MTREAILTLFAGDDEQAQRVHGLLAQIDSEHRTKYERLLALFDEAPVYMAVCDGPELRIAMVNRLTRETPVGASLVGKTLREVYSGDNPIIQAMERVFATGVPEKVFGLPVYLPTDAYVGRYFTRHFVPRRDGQGNVDGVLIVSYEVTEQVQARLAEEEKKRHSQTQLHYLFALLEEAPIFISVLHCPDLRIAMMNRRTRELFGGRDLIGLSFSDVVSPDNATLAAVRRVSATGVPETLEEVSAEVDGVAGRSFTNTVVPVRNAAGKITSVMTASVETTQHRRAEEALEAQARDLENARREAVEASRIKDDFLAMVGHELRNPLAPMVMTLEVMRLRGTKSREVDLLERQVRNLTRLVDDLLDVSRIKRGMVELKCRNVSLSTIVNRALEMTSPLIEQRRHRINTDIATAAVRADPDRLAQVVANLVTNAAKYSDIGSVIRILAQPVEGSVRLVVSDDGIGIAPEMIGRVFDAFVQQPQVLARSQGGLGLGLAIVKSLVEAHGGTVSAHSDGPGKGSTFVVEIPATDDPSDGISATQLENWFEPSIAPKRILVVDDNRDAALVLQGGLRTLGHEVVAAHDGPSALAAARSFRPQVGFLDIGLPGMDGYELAVALRAAHDMTLIAITGYGQDCDRRRSRDAGFEGHLVKPVELQQIARLLQQLNAGAPPA